MSSRLPLPRSHDCVRLAQRLSQRPCNREGADKTWVIEVMEEMEKLFSGARLLRPGEALSKTLRRPRRKPS